MAHGVGGQARSRTPTRGAKAAASPPPRRRCGVAWRIHSTRNVPVPLAGSNMDDHRVVGLARFGISMSGCACDVLRPGRRVGDAERQAERLERVVDGLDDVPHDRQRRVEGAEVLVAGRGRTARGTPRRSRRPGRRAGCRRRSRRAARRRRSLASCSASSLRPSSSTSMTPSESSRKRE